MPHHHPLPADLPAGAHHAFRDESFQEVLAEQLRHAPWFALSLVVHALVLGVLFMIKLEPRLAREEVALTQRVLEPPQEIVDEPEEAPIEPETEEVVEPKLVDALSQEESKDDSDEMDPLDSEPNPSDSEFESELFNDITGIGGGAGGNPNGLGGGGRGRGGPPPGTTVIRAIDNGLRWLAEHQDPSGKWSASEYMAHCPAADCCDGPGQASHDVGITALALLAFLGDGHTPRQGKYRENAKKAVLWLRGQQDEDGLFGQESGHGYMYSHAIASLAMIEAYGLSKYTLLRKPAQRAVHYIQRARNPYKVWRYYPQDGQNDTSVTGWMVFALKSAKEFDLEVDADALKFAMAWFDQVSDPSTGQAGYTKRGELSSRKAGLVEKFPAEKTESLTAVALLCRIFLGQTPKSNPSLLAAADTLLRKPPVWNPSDGSIDLYYWYYGTYAMFQIGGRHWKQWRHAMSSAIIKTQRSKGHALGSWDPISAWGEDGGRVYATAMNVLSMEVYYRYTRLLRAQVLTGDGFSATVARRIRDARRMQATPLLAALVLSPALWAQTSAPASRPSSAPVGATRIDYPKWQRVEVGLGVHLARKRFPRLFGHPQSLQILEIAGGVRSVRVRVAAPPEGGLFRTSELARDRGALAAINGGYFSPQAEAVGLLRIDGKQRFAPNPRMRGALLIDPRGQVSIDSGENAVFTEFRDALSAGPMLVRNGEAAVGTEIEHFDERHPRTAVGSRPDGRLFFVTVDGRARGKAAGMTCAELARIFVELGCDRALNLDGGGSTTMWVRGAGDTGIVNHPCDNHAFDAGGERRVANCVLIHSKDVLVLEESDVTPQPTREGPLSAMKHRLAPDASRGGWLEIPGKITVGIDAQLDFAGSWEVWGRLPRGAPSPAKIAWNPGMLESRALKGRLRATGAWLRLGQIHVSEPELVRFHFSGRDRYGIDALRLVQK